MKSSDQSSRTNETHLRRGGMASVLRTFTAVTMASTALALTPTVGAKMDFIPGFAAPQALAQGEEDGDHAMPAAETAADYLFTLSLTRGHLWAATQLHANGHTDAANTHVKHPESELYAALVPAMERFNAPRSDTELERLATLIEGAADKEEVAAAYQTVLAALGNAESAADPVVTDADQVHAIWKLTEQAAVEYDAAYENGNLVNAHEYQDAYGFLTDAERRLELVGSTVSPDDVDKIGTAIDAMLAVFTIVMPPETATAKASFLYCNASRVRLLM